jgi:hypothetical protein
MLAEAVLARQSPSIRIDHASAYARSASRAASYNEFAGMISGVSGIGSVAQKKVVSVHFPYYYPCRTDGSNGFIDENVEVGT